MSLMLLRVVLLILPAVTSLRQPLPDISSGTAIGTATTTAIPIPSHNDHLFYFSYLRQPTDADAAVPATRSAEPPPRVAAGVSLECSAEDVTAAFTGGDAAAATKSGSGTRGANGMLGLFGRRSLKQGITTTIKVKTRRVNYTQEIEVGG